MSCNFAIPLLDIHLPTYSKPPLHSNALGVSHCRHVVVVSGACYEPLWKCDGGHLTLGGGSVSVDQVGVGWVCTIVNGAGVPWLIECALHKGAGYVGGLDINLNVSATCEEKIF